MDSSGSAYVVGATGSPNFTVTPNAFQKNLIGNSNAFIAKLSPDGSHLTYSSLLGGGSELTGGIAIDSDGAAYITGATLNDFPVTQNAFQKQPGANCLVEAPADYVSTGDAFVAKISPDGGSLVYASYLGGSCGEHGQGILLNSDGSVWVVGSTFSPDFPLTPDALQSAFGGGYGDGFLARISADGDHLEYSTYLGGSDYDAVNALTRDAAGNLFLAGASAGFSQPASKNAYQPQSTPPCLTLDFGPPVFNIDGNAFVMKLNPNGTEINGLTYLGSQCSASASRIVLDNAGAPWIVATGSPTFPLASPLEIQYGGIASKLSPDLSQLLFSTTFSPVNDLALSSNGDVYLAGGSDVGSASKAYVAEIDPTLPAISLDNVLSFSQFDLSNVGHDEYGEIVSPGKVIRIIGRGIGPASKTPGIIRNGAIATSVAGVKLTFDGIAAPLLYVSSTEIGCIVPFGIAGQTVTTLQVTYNGLTSNAAQTPVAPLGMAPEILGIFNADFTANSEANPAELGSYMSVYITGGGQTEPASTDGEIYGFPLPQPVSPITIDSSAGPGPLLISYAGAAPGLADGIFQINFYVPAPAASGFQAATLSTGSGSTNFIFYVK